MNALVASPSSNHRRRTHPRKDCCNPWRLDVKIGSFLILACLLPTFAAPAAEAPAAPVFYKPNDLIVILGAVPQEITVFTAAMGNPPKKTLWGIPYYQGKLKDKDVVVAITG